MNTNTNTNTHSTANLNSWHARYYRFFWGIHKSEMPKTEGAYYFMFAFSLLIFPLGILPALFKVLSRNTNGIGNGLYVFSFFGIGMLTFISVMKANSDSAAHPEFSWFSFFWSHLTDIFFWYMIIFGTATFVIFCFSFNKALIWEDIDNTKKDKVKIH